MESRGELEKDIKRNIASRAVRADYNAVNHRLCHFPRETVVFLPLRIDFLRKRLHLPGPAGQRRFRTGQPVAALRKRIQIAAVAVVAALEFLLRYQPLQGQLEQLFLLCPQRVSLRVQPAQLR